jgi:hypothetical protein
MASNVKGRLKFFNFGTVNSQHIITLVDSQSLLTLATTLNRPPASANDTYIGLDQGNTTTSQSQLAFGAPVAISNYIGNIGDGSSYLERLTSSVKTFNVPVATPSATIALSTSSLAGSTCKVQTTTLNGLSTSSIVKWSWSSTPIGITGYDTGRIQISTFAITNTANIVVCNITGTAITPGSISLNLRAEL